MADALKPTQACEIVARTAADRGCKSENVAAIRSPAASFLVKVSADLAIDAVERALSLSPASEAERGGDVGGWKAEAARQEELAKIYRRAQLLAETKLCREETNSAGWKKRAAHLEKELAIIRALPLTPFTDTPAQGGDIEARARAILDDASGGREVSDPEPLLPIALPYGKHAAAPKPKHHRCRFCRKTLTGEGQNAWGLCDPCFLDAEFPS